MQYLAFDLGADSGRAIMGTLTDSGLRLEEIHRFANVPVKVQDTLHWDVLRLWGDVLTGLQKALQTHDAVRSAGVDAWGCDFALFDILDRLMFNPVHYRDARTEGMMEKAFEKVPRETIFARTGVQFLPVNTLYQLMAMDQLFPDLGRVFSFLTIPDLFNFWLTGEHFNEFTNATTTQCFNPRTMDWAWELLGRDLLISTGIFNPIVHPGTHIGDLLPSLAQDLAIDSLPVIAPACHDTGSAVAAVPAEPGDDSVWISSGTWSIMGVVVPEAILSAAALQHNFTNEGGVGQTFRFCKNVMGLWLLQECRRAWMRQGAEHSYAELSAMGATEARAAAIIDPDHASFLPPGDMPQRIRQYCADTNQPVPQSKPEILRCITDSLALKYRWVLARLEEILDKTLGPIHVVGGGSLHEGLNQATADATGRVVIAGPTEATATGNIMVQAVASDEIASFQDIGPLVRQSATLKTFEPRQDAATRGYWDERFAFLEERMAGMDST